MLKLAILPINVRLGILTIFLIMMSTAIDLIFMVIIYKVLVGLDGSGAMQISVAQIEISFKQLVNISVGLVFIKMIAAFGAIKARALFVFSTQVSLSVGMLEKYLLKPYSEVESQQAAELVRTVATETQNIVKLVLMPFITIVTEFVPIIFVIGFSLYHKPQESIAVLSSIAILGVAIQYCYKNRLSDWGEKRRVIEESITSALIDIDRLFKEIKIYRLKDEFIGKFKIRQEQLGQIGEKQHCAQEFPKVILESVVFSCLTLYLAFGLMTSKGTGVVLGTVAVLGLTAIKIIPSVNRIVSSINVFRFGKPAFLKIAKEWEKSPIVANYHLKPVECQTLELIDLSFERKGKGKKKVFDKINISLKKGEICGIKGPSGIGKSTLLNVLMGLLQHTGGQIRVNGAELVEEALYQKASIGIVPQTSYVVSGTLSYNISLEREDYNDKKLKISKALELSNMTDFIAELDDGIETVIAENSKSISGGQAQRISIARSLYNEADILVFDEFTSALDRKTEEQILKDIRLISKDKIIILVSHSDSVLEYCDKVLDLSDKKKNIGHVESEMNTALTSN